MPDLGLGTYWFEEGGKTATANAARYHDAIKKFYNNLSKTLSEGQLRLTWFIQDGTSSRTAHQTVAYLKEFFILPSLLLTLITSGPNIAPIQSMELLVTESGKVYKFC